MKKNVEIIEKLIRNINHEIKNPLTVIRGYAQLLAMKEASEEFQKKTAKYIIENVDLIDDRISALYKAFSVSYEEKTQIDLKNELHSIIGNFDEEIQSRIRVHSEFDGITEICKKAFQRLIECLVGNFNWKNNPDATVEIFLKPHNGRCEIFISYCKADFSNYSHELFYLPFMDKNNFSVGTEIFEVYCICESNGWNLLLIKETNKSGFSITI